MEHTKYLCWHCQAKCQEFSETIQHAIKEHSNQPLKIRVFTLNSETGKPSYITKNYQIVPNELDSKSEIIAKENDKICIQTKSECETGNVDVVEAKDSEVVSSDATDILDKNELRKLEELIPPVAEAMKLNGYLPVWIKFHELVSDNKFPMENISFRLFLDVVSFLSSQSTTNMRYSEEVKKTKTVFFQ